MAKGSRRQRMDWTVIRGALAAHPEAFNDPTEAQFLATATIYTWTSDAWLAAARMRGPEVIERPAPEPEDEPELWLFDAFTATFDRPSVAPDKKAPPDGAAVTGFLRVPYDVGWAESVIWFSDPDDPVAVEPHIFAMAVDRPGQPMPRGTLSYQLTMAALWRFTPAALVRRPSPGTHAQRRRGEVRDPRRTHIVTLRPLASAAVVGGPRSVDWAARWHVRPYVQVRRGKLVAVAGHVKGPPEKPIAATIYQVRR